MSAKGIVLRPFSFWLVSPPPSNAAAASISAADKVDATFADMSINLLLLINSLFLFPSFYLRFTDSLLVTV